MLCLQIRFALMKPCGDSDNSNFTRGHHLTELAISRKSWRRKGAKKDANKRIEPSFLSRKRNWKKAKIPVARAQLTCRRYRRCVTTIKEGQVGFAVSPLGYINDHEFLSDISSISISHRAHHWKYSFCAVIWNYIHFWPP